MHYKVLLVDDDSIVRMGIKMVVNWDELGFEIAGEASNGEEALEMIKTLKPDLVLTDMNMPKCDGINLMQYAKEQFPDTKFIVLSCHSDFDYVKNSLKLGASDYLLKSQIVHTEELSAALKNVRDSLDSSNKNRSQGSKLKQKDASSNSKGDNLVLETPFQKKQFLIDFLTGTINDEQILNQGFSKLKLDMISKNYFLIALELDEYKDTLSKYSNVEALNSVVLNVLQDITSQYGTAESVCISENLFIVIIDIAVKSQLISSYDRALSIAERIRISLKKFIEITGVLYLDKGTSLLQLPESYEKINRFVCYKTFVQNDSIIQLSNIPDNSQQMELVSFPEFPEVLEKGKDLDSTHTSNDNSKTMVEEILEYIVANYQKNISLDDLAKLTNFNKYYICKKFKKDTGVSIVNYILEYRISKAKELLLSSGDKIYKVAQEVGFNDTSYFNVMFKKITGLTPKEYIEKDKQVK